MIANRLHTTGLIVLVAAAFCRPATLTAQELPSFSDVLGDGKGKSDLSAADFGAAIPRRIPVEPGTAEIRFPFKAADAGGAFTWTLVWEDGKKTDIPVRISDAVFKVDDTSPGASPESSVTKALPDACLEMPGQKVRFHTRPNPEFYNDTELGRLQAKWMSFEDAAAHVFRLSLQIGPKDAALSLDGQYVTRFAGASRLKEIVFPLPSGTAVTVIPAADWSPYLPLDLRSLNRPGAMTDAVLKRGGADRVPLEIGAAGQNADVGKVRDVSPPVDFDNCVYRYLERNAFAGLPEALLASVPAVPYARAWVLCAAEDDPAREGSFNVRLTRFFPGGIGNAMVMTRVDLPKAGAVAPSNMWPAGSVDYGPKAARKTAPLWLVEVPLNSSEIQDVVYSDWAAGRLDLELLGLTRNSKSAVHVFAVTLERSPVAMEVKQVAPGSVFHNDEKPEMRVELRPAAKAAVTLRWRVEDVWGNEAVTGEQPFAFAAGDPARTHTVPLGMPDFGWYKVVFSLHEPGGRLLLAHTAAFAHLPPDTRKAGYESPFGCWWQQYLHSHMTDPAVIGPLLLKAGIRRTTATCQSEAVMKPYKVTLDMIPWSGGYRPPGSPPQTPQEWFADYEAKVRDYRDRFPNSRMAMIFHESYDSGMGAEVWGGEPDPLTAYGHIEKAKMASTLLRAKFPDLKIIVGNSGWSGALVSQLLRGGLSPDVIDGLGMERLLGYFPKDTMPPERHEASYTIRQVGLKYGCKAPPTDCYESGGRGNYGMSQRQIAEYVVRDSLVGLAWGYLYVGLGTISENVNGYYHTRWGGDSILRRTPLLYPQPQYVAIATMTRELDCAKLVKRVPTGSHTAYALEFARPGESVYVLWTPRGTCEMTLRFPAEGAVRITGLYGKSRTEATANGEIRVTAGEEVTYVTAPAAASAVTAGARRFPLDQPPATAVVADPLTNAAAWIPVSSPFSELGPFPYRWLPWRTSGKGRLTAVRDLEKGPCLSVELLAEGELPTDLLSECLTFKAARPVPLPGRPDTIGLWVKGNSCWGRVLFEIRDAKGERFRGGAYIYEPRGTSYLDFDGWCFVTLPLTEQSPVRSRFHYYIGHLWEGNGGDGVMDYPLQVTGFTVEMKRKALDLADMAEMDRTVLVKDLSVYGPEVTPTPAAAPAPSADVPVDPSVLYSDEDLQATPPGSRPAAFADGCVVREEAGQRLVACERGVNGLFRYLRYYGSPSWLDTQWSFRFRFPQDGKIGFQALVRTGFSPTPFVKAPRRGAQDQCKGVKIEFTRDGVYPAVQDGLFEMAKGVAWADKGLAPLEAGRWYRAVIRAAGRALDVSLEQEGRLVPVYRGPIPAGGGGVNLYTTNPVDVAELDIRQVAATEEDWQYAGRIRRDADSPVAGGSSVRIDGPFMVADTTAVETGRPYVVSAFVRSDRADAPATLVIGDRRREVKAGPAWSRVSFMASPKAMAEDDPRCLFAVKGSDAAPLWVADPRVEAAAPDPAAKRAQGWGRSLERDYGLETANPREGRYSLKLAGGGMAWQETDLAKEDFRPLMLSAWVRGDPAAKAKLQLELFRDRKYWAPMNPNEVEPRETFTLELRPAGSGWTLAQAKFVPKNLNKRFRLTLLAEGTNGAVWVDSAALTPLGSAAAPAAPAAMTDAFGETKEKVPAGSMDEEIAALTAMGKDASPGENWLRNPGFEELTTNGVVTAASGKPGPLRPTVSTNTWLCVP